MSVLAATAATSCVRTGVRPPSKRDMSTVGCPGDYLVATNSTYQHAFVNEGDVTQFVIQGSGYNQDLGRCTFSGHRAVDVFLYARVGPASTGHYLVERAELSQVRYAVGRDPITSDANSCECPPAVYGSTSQGRLEFPDNAGEFGAVGPRAV